MWKASEHEVIVKNVSKNSGISQANINYMVKTAKLADRGIHGDKIIQNYGKVKAFHGKENYIASLKYLWNYANLIGQGKSYADAKSITKIVIDKSKVHKDDKHDIKLAINATEYMLKEQNKAYNSIQ